MRVRVALAALLVAGCASDVASRSRTGSVAPGSSATGAPPDIEVVSPAPGSWLPGPDVTFEVVVRQPSAPASVTVNGVPASPLGGRYGAPVHLGAGLETVTVLVRDVAGNTTAASFSYEVGPWRPLPSPVDGAALVHLGPQTIPLLEKAAKDELDKVDFNALILPVNPVLAQSFVGGLVTLDIDILNVSHGPWSVQLAFQNGGIGVAAEVPAVTVDAVVRDPSGSLIPLHVVAQGNATRAAATSVASFAIAPGGSASVVFAPPVVTIDHFTLTAQGALPSFLAPLVQGTLSRTLERVLSGTIQRALARTLAKHLGRVTGPHAVHLNGADFTFTGQLESATIDTSGIALTLGADVTAPLASLTVPGLAGAAPVPPVLPGVSGVELAVSPDLLAKALGTLWQAGALDMEIDGKAWSGLGATLPPLDVQGLSKLLPELRVFPANTPLILRVSPKLPPQLTVAPGLVTLRLGEVLVEIATDPASGPSRTLVGLSVAGVVPVVPDITANVLTLSSGPMRPDYFFAVVEQPVVRFDSNGLEVRLAIVLDVLVPRLLKKVQVALPLVHGYNFGNNPVPTKTESPFNSATTEHHLTLGIGFRVGPVSIDASYVHAFVHASTIDHSAVKSDWDGMRHKADQDAFLLGGTYEF